MTDPEDDNGFTLIELLLVTAIVGLVIPAIAGVMVVFFRTSYVASVRTDRAHDFNLVSAYLQPDLASTRNAPTLSGSGCTSMMDLSWTQQDYVPNGNGTTHSYHAVYAAVSASGADGPFALQRTLIVDGVPGKALVLGHNLDAACSAVFAVTGSQATLSMTEPDSSKQAEPSVLRASGNIGGRS